MVVKLAKETNKSNIKKKCDICKEVKEVYLETKIKNTHSEDSIFCSKKCVKRGFGNSI